MNTMLRQEGTSRKVFVLSAVLCILCVQVGTVTSQDCAFTPNDGLQYLYMPEEQPIGYPAYNFTVTPSNATVTWECDNGPEPAIDDACYYFERLNNSIIVKKIADIENEIFIGSVDTRGIFTFRDNKKLTCITTDSGSGATVSIEVGIVNVNEHTPSMPADVVSFNTSVFEMALPGTQLIFDLPFEAEDADVIEEFTCEQQLDPSIPFRVTCETIDTDQVFRKALITLTVTDPPPLLDYETQNFYSFDVAVKDNADFFGNINTGYLSVVVNVLDLDDRNPVFEYSSYSAMVDEGYQGVVNVSPDTMYAKDGDTLNARVLYEIENSRPISCSENIAINQTSGEVNIRGPLNFLSSCELSIKATEQYNPERIDTVPLTIYVTDVNNNCPYFQDPSYLGQMEPGDEYVLLEGSTDERLLITAYDADELFTGSFTDTSDRFDLEDINGGRVYVTAVNPNDLINGELIEFNVIVLDNSANISCSDSQTTVTVNITNLSPVFEDIDPVAHVNETAPPGTLVVQVSATNADGHSDDLFYEIITASEGGTDVFEIGEESGIITVKSNATDVEDGVKQYWLIIEAQDRRDESRIRVASTSVTIIINDINDSPPSFSHAFYSASIPESFSPMAPIITIQADDEDISSTLSYSFVRESGPFQIDTNSGVIMSTTALNRDPPNGTEVYDLTVMADDGIFETTAGVKIILSDVNDNAPAFVESSLQVEINETDSEVQVQLNATDVDSGMNGLVTYFVDSPDSENITVNELTGLLTVAGPFDREIESEIVIVVRAEDGGEPKLSDTAMVTVTILDENDNAPTIVDNQCLSAEVFENIAVGTFMCAVLAVDDDEPNNKNAMVKYSLEGENASLFIVEKNERQYGEIRVNSVIDREMLLNTNPLQVTIKAEDGGIPPLSASVNISIVVNDVNDNAPEFEELEHVVFTEDALSPGDLVYSLTPRDVDLSPGNIVLCRISGGDDSLFFINSNGTTCMVYSKAQIDIDPLNPLILSITAYNPDNETLISDKSTTTLTIYVGISFCLISIDPNEYSMTVKDTEVIAGQTIVLVNATSSCGVDEGGDIVFNVTEQVFSPDLGNTTAPSDDFDIMEMTGEVYAVRNNPEIGAHLLTIEAYNASSDNPKQTRDTGTVEIIVIPNFNTAPKFDENMYSQTLQVPKEAEDLVFDLGDRASDIDAPLPGIGEITFTEISEISDGGDGRDLFEVTPDGRILLSRDLRLEDIDVGYSINLTVRVEDKALEPLSDTAYVLIAITLPYTIPPMFTNSSCENQTVFIKENIPVGTEICAVEAEGASSISYGLTDETSFRIDAMNGKIFTYRAFDYDKPKDDRQFAVVIYAESAEGQRAYTTLEVTVLDVNDKRPIFEQKNYMFSITEDSESSGCIKTVGSVKATDEDSFPENTDIVYLLQGEINDFAIQDSTGVISTTTCIDREDSCYIGGTVTLNVLAMNNASSNINLNDTASVVISVEDINDNSPVFDPREYEETLGILLPYYDLLTVTAKDMDQGINNGAVYYVLAQDQSAVVYELFTVNRTTGIVSTKNTTGLEEEEYFEILLVVEAWDQGSPPRMDDAVINVFVSPSFLNEPIFRDENRVQRLDIDENVFDCIAFEPPEFPNGSIPIFSLIEDSSEGKFKLKCSQKAEVCLSDLALGGLDREEQEGYTLIVQATLCNETDTQPCKPEECLSVVTADIRSHRVVTEDYKIMQERNQAVLEIIVGDKNDEKPVIQRGYWPGSYDYIIGVADDLAFNTSVSQVLASDADINSKLEYSLQLTQTLDSSCTARQNAFEIGNNGDILVKESLFQYLTISGSNIQQEMSACDYLITVTDTATEKDYPEEGTSEPVMAKIKILYVFEHVIITFQNPPDEILPDVEKLMRCLSDALNNNYVIIVEDVRSHLVDEGNGTQQSVINPEWTDVWAYAIDNTTGIIVKYWEFKSAWDAATGKYDDCLDAPDATRDATLLGITQARPFNYKPLSPPYMDIVGYVFMALGVAIALASLLCMVVVFESLHRDQLNQGQHIKANIDTWSEKDEDNDIEGAINLGYDADSVTDLQTIATTFVTTDGKKYVLQNGDAPRYVETSAGTETEWTEPIGQSSWLADAKNGNVQLFESQELTMDVFYDSDVDPEGYLLPPVVPTVASITVEREVYPLRESNDYSGDDEDDKENTSEQDHVQDQENEQDQEHEEDDQDNGQEHDQAQDDQYQDHDNDTTLNKIAPIAVTVNIYEKNEIKTEQSEENVDTPDSDEDINEPTAMSNEEDKDEDAANALLMSQTQDGRFIPIEFSADEDDDKEDADPSSTSPPSPPPPPPPPPPPAEQVQDDKVQATQYVPGLTEFPPPPPDIVNMGQLTVYPVDEGDPTIDVHNQYF